MRIGIHTAQRGSLARPAPVRAIALAAEQLGYSSLWAVDGPGTGAVPGREGAGPVLDSVAVLATSAGVTSRVGLGIEVGAATVGPPRARSLASLHVLSEGRLTVVLASDGSPDLRDAEAAFGALDRQWADVAGVRPPVLLATTTPAGLALVARRADGWSAGGLTPDRIRPLWAQVRDAAAGHGRDPDSLHLVVRADIVLTGRPAVGDRPCYQGSHEQVAGDVDAALRAGASEVALALDGDLSLDEALDGYARVAEAVELAAAA